MRSSTSNGTSIYDTRAESASEQALVNVAATLALSLQTQDAAPAEVADLLDMMGCTESTLVARKLAEHGLLHEDEQEAAAPIQGHAGAASTGRAARPVP